MISEQHIYEVRPRKDKRGVDLISDVLPFGRLWYDGPNAISNAVFTSTAKPGCRIWLSKLCISDSILDHAALFSVGRFWRRFV